MNCSSSAPAPASGSGSSWRPREAARLGGSSEGTCRPIVEADRSSSSAGCSGDHSSDSATATGGPSSASTAVRLLRLRREEAEAGEPSGEASGEVSTATATEEGRGEAGGKEIGEVAALRRVWAGEGIGGRGGRARGESGSTTGEVATGWPRRVSTGEADRTRRCGEAAAAGESSALSSRLAERETATGERGRGEAATGESGARGRGEPGERAAPPSGRRRPSMIPSRPLTMAEMSLRKCLGGEAETVGRPSSCDEVAEEVAECRSSSSSSSSSRSEAENSSASVPMRRPRPRTEPDEGGECLSAGVRRPVTSLIRRVILVGLVRSCLAAAVAAGLLGLAWESGRAARWGRGVPGGEETAEPPRPREVALPRCCAEGGEESSGRSLERWRPSKAAAERSCSRRMRREMDWLRPVSTSDECVDEKVAPGERGRAVVVRPSWFSCSAASCSSRAVTTSCRPWICCTRRPLSASKSIFSWNLGGRGISQAGRVVGLGGLGLPGRALLVELHAHGVNLGGELEELLGGVLRVLLHDLVAIERQREGIGLVGWPR